jgi:ABC-type Mn2+/Zn2+ transport system ATPase subunit
MVYHNSSLEFRAKLFAAIIGANKKVDECEEKILEEVAREIYPDDEARANVLVLTTKEYVNKIIQNNGLDLNELILAIDHELKEVDRFCDKVDLERLQRFLICTRDDEETTLTQQRILEFLAKELEDFRKIR